MINERDCFIAKELLACSATGEEWPINIKIWAPEPSEVAPWACKVEVTRLFSPPNNIYGNDSWQAQTFAMHFAATLVKDFVCRGGKIYWPIFDKNETRQEVDALDLLPQFN